MKSLALLTGLDVGSSKISAVAAEVDRNGELRITAQASCPSRGISRGAITDLGGATDSVAKALAKLCGRISRRPANIYVNISGQDVKGEKSKGMIPLSIRGREITRGDVARCVNVAGTIKLPFDREIMHTIVHGFSIDDQPAIRDPLGLYASRLSCETYVVSASANHIQNLYKCVNGAGYDVKETVFTGIAEGRSVLDEEEKEEGVMLLDMGYSLTEMTVFFQGALAELAIIPSGWSDIKKDPKDEGRFDAIVSKVKAKVKELASRGGIKSIVLTGGVALLDDTVERIEEELSPSAPVKMGVAKAVKGNISSAESMQFATAIGLVKYGYEKYRKKAIERRNLVRNLSEKVLDIFNNYF